VEQAATLYAASGRQREVAWRRVPGWFGGADEAGDEAVVGTGPPPSRRPRGCGSSPDRRTRVLSRSASVEPLGARDQGLGLC
jgi:hypothetical protein